MDTTTERKDDAEFTSAQSSVVTGSRAAAPPPRARCVILFTPSAESALPPTDLLNALNHRKVETRTHTRLAEALTEVAVCKIESDDDNSTKESKPATSTTATILILVDSPDNPEIRRFLSAIRRYFPAVAVWSYRKNEKPRLKRFPNPKVSPKRRSANGLAGDPSEENTPPRIQPSASEKRSHDPGSQSSITPEEPPAVESFRFEDHLKPQQPPHYDANQFDEPQNRDLNDTDQFFAPPQFDSDHCDRDSDDDREVDVADDREPAHNPGYVSEEELAMLLGDGDFLFTDDDPEDEPSHPHQERDGGNRHD